jgi:hypothetical protein
MCLHGLSTGDFVPAPKHSLGSGAGPSSARAGARFERGVLVGRGEPRAA